MLHHLSFFYIFKFFLKTFSSAPYALLGKVVSGARVVREPGKKWYLSHAQYGANMLPSYLHGVLDTVPHLVISQIDM